MEDSLPIILLFDQETKKTTIIFTCMQISSAIGGPKSSSRMSGKMYIPIIHELVCAFLDVSGAKNRTTAIPSFTTGNVSIFRQALYKDGAAKITKDLCLHGLLPESVVFLLPSQAGGFSGSLLSSLIVLLALGPHDEHLLGAALENFFKK